MNKKIKKTKKNKSFSLKNEKEQSHICEPCKCYIIDPSNYRFYQTLSTVKIYITLHGVENLNKASIKVQFQRKSFELTIFELNGYNYHLQFNCLLNEIIPSKSKFSIKKDKVILELNKECQKIWKSLEELVRKEEWVSAYCEYLVGTPEFVDLDSMYGFAEKICCDEIVKDHIFHSAYSKDSLITRDQLLHLNCNDYNYLKPSPRMHHFIPALRRITSFKSLDEAISFYQSELKKDHINKALYISLGGTLLEKMREERLSRTHSNPSESIYESILSAPAKDVGQSDSKGRRRRHKRLSGKEEEAEMKKNEGNSYYKTGKFYAALQLYLEAIELWPENHFLYSNACASYMMLGMYNEALAMAQKSVWVDPNFSGGYLRIGKCNLALGNIKASQKSLIRAKELGCSEEEVDSQLSSLKSLSILLKQGKRGMGYKEYEYAASVYELTYTIATSSSHLLLLWAECLSHCGNFLKLKLLAKHLFDQNLECPDAHCILGMVAYYQDQKDQAILHFKKTLKISKSHTKAKLFLQKATDLYDKKENGNHAYNEGKYVDALKFYQEGLLIDPENTVVTAKIYYDIAMVNVEMKDIDRAIESLTAAIDMKEDYERAYVKRASLYQERGENSNAVKDLQVAVNISPTECNKRSLEMAESLVKEVCKKNYYEILNIPRTATSKQVGEAYRSSKLALIFQHEGSPDKQKRKDIFKDLNEAYKVLRDPQKRRNYDEYMFGEDQAPGWGLEVEDFYDMDPDYLDEIMTKSKEEFMRFLEPMNYFDLFGGEGGAEDMFYDF